VDPEQFWSSSGAVLERIWSGSGADPEQFWSSSGADLERIQSSSGAVLEQFWSSFRECLLDDLRAVLEQI